MSRAANAGTWVLAVLCKQGKEPGRGFAAAFCLPPTLKGPFLVSYRSSEEILMGQPHQALCQPASPSLCFPKEED